MLTARTETGGFPMKIDAQCRNLKFLENKLSQITCDDIKWNENKAFWRKKVRSTLDQIGLGDL